MTIDTKIPVHSVVSVICDALADLQPNDQVRTLEAVRIALGVSTAETDDRRAAAFQKLLQLGTVVAERISSEGAATAPSAATATTEPCPSCAIVAELARSFGSDQLSVLMQTLDVSQKIMLMEILNRVQSFEQPPDATP